LSVFLYRCDDHFHTDMLKGEKVIGIIAYRLYKDRVRCAGE